MDQIRSASKQQAEKLGHAVSGLANYMEPLANASIGLASKTVNSRQQQALLDQTKTVEEAALQFLIAGERRNFTLKKKIESEFDRRNIPKIPR